SRLMLHVAHACSADSDASTFATVFASRHGEATTTVSLLEALARAQPLTAASFSHSVHNTQAGLFSIAAKNHEISSALAGAADTFPCAFLETLALMQRDPERQVLLVVADEPLHPVFATADAEPKTAYAVAFIVGRRGDGTRVRCTLGRSGALATRSPWPQAIEFLRWLLSDESSLAMGTGVLRWMWTRD
ncbi:MAG: beta-ketoacyl synthase chain length factor, partial [Vicinamibacterales bacterium]